MKIIVCNIGSSSFKFQLFDMASETQLARGYTERVGRDDAVIAYWAAGEKVYEGTTSIPTHREAVQHALDYLTTLDRAVLKSLNDLDGVADHDARSRARCRSSEFVIIALLSDVARHFGGRSHWLGGFGVGVAICCTPIDLFLLPRCSPAPSFCLHRCTLLHRLSEHVHR
jgi:hypothetical protein